MSNLESFSDKKALVNGFFTILLEQTRGVKGKVDVSSILVEDDKKFISLQDIQRLPDGMKNTKAFISSLCKEYEVSRLKKQKETIQGLKALACVERSAPIASVEEIKDWSNQEVFDAVAYINGVRSVSNFFTQLGAGIVKFNNEEKDTLNLLDSFITKQLQVEEKPKVTSASLEEELIENLPENLQKGVRILIKHKIYNASSLRNHIAQRVTDNIDNINTYLGYTERPVNISEVVTTLYAFLGSYTVNLSARGIGIVKILKDTNFIFDEPIVPEPFRGAIGNLIFTPQVTQTSNYYTDRIGIGYRGMYHTLEDMCLLAEKITASTLPIFSVNGYSYTNPSKHFGKMIDLVVSVMRDLQANLQGMSYQASFDLEKRVPIFIKGNCGFGWHPLGSDRRIPITFFSKDSVSTEPLASTYYLGMELELATPMYKFGNYTVNALMLYNFPFTSKCMIPSTDSSIQPEGIEYVFQPMEPMVLLTCLEMVGNNPIINDLMEANKSTGIHVHVSKSAFPTATSFSKFYRFYGGSTGNRKFIETIAERGNVNYSRLNYDKSLEDGVKIHNGKFHTVSQSFRNNDMFDKYRAVNVGRAGSTYEIRIFQSTNQGERLLAIVEFVWASIRFATYINRVALKGGDFVAWLLRWPNDFPYLIKDLRKKAGVPSTKKEVTLDDFIKGLAGCGKPTSIQSIRKGLSIGKRIEPDDEKVLKASEEEEQEFEKKCLAI